MNAAGATFPDPIYSKWFSDFHTLHPNVEINYQSIGSGSGIQQLKARTVDFGASNMPLNDELLSQFSLLSCPSVIYGVLGIFMVVPLVRTGIGPFRKSTLGFLPLFKRPGYGLGY